MPFHGALAEEYKDKVGEEEINTAIEELRPPWLRTWRLLRRNQPPSARRL